MNGIGKQVSQVLSNKKITNAEFASQLGLSVQQLYKVFRGKSHSTVNVLKEMSRILDIPSDLLLQDFGKEFLVYAIDDYLNMIDKDKAQNIIEQFGKLIVKGDDEVNE